MAAQIIRDGKLWLDKYNLSGDMNAIALGAMSELKDGTVLGDLSRRRRAGLDALALTLAGFWNGGAGNVDEVLFGNIAVADVPLTVGQPTGAEGDTAFFFKALLGEYKPGAAVGDMFGFQVTGDDSGGDGLIRGTLMNVAARTTTGTGTIVQLGAVSALQKLYAALHVVAYSGLTNAIIKVQSAATGGFGSPTDRITFTTVTGLTSEYKSLAGAITDAFWRVTWTLTGVGSITFIAPVGIQ